ncbi:MAG TPA: hypothetical protein VHA52_09065 [Candidatus Babeliaceae bacterium]|nr:hypothetical protein [Candidatus Babeliaceae bacterium]
MSLKSFIEKIEAAAGIEGKALLASIGEAKIVATNIEAVLKNPVADMLLSVITKGVSDAVLPKVEALLDKVITDLSDGASIEADVNAAPDLEAKFKIFIADLCKYNIVKQDMFLQKICSLLLAGLDNNNLSQSLYDLYSQAAYTLSHKAA